MSPANDNFCPRVRLQQWKLRRRLRQVERRVAEARSMVMDRKGASDSIRRLTMRQYDQRLLADALAKLENRD